MSELRFDPSVRATGSRGWAVLLGLVLVAGAACGGEPSEGEGGWSRDEVATAWFAEDSCCADDSPCQDGLWCNGHEWCNCWGECEPGAPINCDDGDPCTLDECDESADRCRRTDIVGPGCGCLVDADCRDGSACTNDTCDPGTGTCLNTAVDCNDGDVCTVDGCDAATGCTHGAIPGCCRVAADCNDGESCTTDTCDAVTGTCVHANLPVGTACASDANACTNDRCNAAGVCQHSAISCDDANICTTDTCNPASGCVRTPVPGCCTTNADCNDLNPCTSDSCNVATGACVRTNLASGTACPADANSCTNDQCDGAGSCIHPPRTGAACDDGLFCNGADTCNASAVCVSAGNPCPAPGVCSIGCNETMDRCDYAASTTVCRASAGVCDQAENCTGSSAVCPADVLRPSTTVCRASAGVCDLAENCTGSSAACPGDAFLNSSTVCRASAGVCDLTEYCTGSSAPCPGDAFQNSTTICRPQAGPCDNTELCTGSSAACPGDAYAPYGTLGRCPADAYTCTQDICTGSSVSCPSPYPLAAGTCLIGTTCYTDGAVNPINPCQRCWSATSTSAWSNQPNGTACTYDAYACTIDTCQAGVCTITSSIPPANDLCTGSPMPTAGSGSSRSWTETGVSYCALDNYNSLCGGGDAAGDTTNPDTVHQFFVDPSEYATYRYRVQVAGPANYDPIAAVYRSSAVTLPCGQSSWLGGCNDDGAGGCWSYAGALPYDGNDSCWLSGATAIPSGNNSVVVDSWSTAGGNYTVKVDRYETVNPTNCIAGQPEIQGGGGYPGNTNISSTQWYYGICTDSSGTPKYAATYHINHTVAPWNVSRGYVVNVRGTAHVPGSFDVNAVLLLNQCSVPQSILGCDNSSDHYAMGSGLGAQLVTGTIPAGRWASVDVTSWNSAPRGNYFMQVFPDDDGDGVVNGSDGSGLMLGAQQNMDANQGAINIPHWPFMDSRVSYIYPYNSWTGFGGREVWYRRTMTSSSRLRVQVMPWVRGETLYASAASERWDPVIYIYFPVAGRFCCDGFWGFSCSNAAAGSTWSCDAWGRGEYEDAYVQTASAGQTYYVGVDAYASNSIGGWYTTFIGNY